MSTTNEVMIRPYTAKELAGLYGVSTKTLRTWMLPHKEAIGERVSHYFTALQIQIIFDRLGLPSVVE